MGECRKIIVEFDKTNYKKKVLYINLKEKNVITRTVQGDWDKETSILTFSIPRRTKFEIKYDKKKFNLEELKIKKKYKLSKIKKSINPFKKMLSLTIMGGFTLVSITFCSNKFENVQMVNNIGNINSPISNTNITEYKKIDETKKWIVSAINNNQIEIGCLTCRKWMTTDGQTYFSDLPRVVKVNLKNGAILSEINIYSFNKNGSTILDLNSGKTNELGYHEKGVIGEDDVSNPMLGFLSTKANSTYSSVEDKDVRKDKFIVNNIGKKKEFYIGFLQTYSTELYEKNQNYLEPKIGVNLLEFIDNTGKPTYYILLSKYSSRYSSNNDVNKRGNMQYEVLNLSDFTNDSTAFREFVYNEDSLTNFIKDEAKKSNSTPAFNSAVNYYSENGEENFIDSYNNINSEIDRIETNRK